MRRQYDDSEIEASISHKVYLCKHLGKVAESELPTD